MDVDPADVVDPVGTELPGIMQDGDVGEGEDKGV